MNKTELVTAMAKKSELIKKDTVKASKAPKFKAGKALKDVVNGR